MTALVLSAAFVGVVTALAALVYLVALAYDEWLWRREQASARGKP